MKRHVSGKNNIKLSLSGCRVLNLTVSLYRYDSDTDNFIDFGHIVRQRKGPF